MFFFPLQKQQVQDTAFSLPRRDNSPSNVLNFNMDLGLKKKTAGWTWPQGPPLEKEKKSEQWKKTGCLGYIKNYTTKLYIIYKKDLPV